MLGYISCAEPSNHVFSAYLLETAPMLKAGALSAAACYNGGVVVASICKTESPLVMETGTRKIARIRDGCCVLYSGLAADSRVLTRKAMDTALEYRGKYGERAVEPVVTLVSKVAMVMQEYTQLGGVRPFGVVLLVAGVDLDGPQLYKVEPSGSFSAWKCLAVGKGSLGAEAMLHEGFEESMDRDRALELVVSVLQKSSVGTSRADIETTFIEEEPYSTS